MAFELPTLPMIGVTPEQFQIWWQQIKDSIEAQEAAQDAAATQLAEVVADLSDAVTDLQNVIRDYSIGLGWTSPGEVLAAADNGTNVTITILSHVRYYGDGSSVNVTGDTLTVAYGPADRYVYYTQASRNGGSVSYRSTTNPNTAAPNRASGRHFLGKIPIPAMGGAATTGGPTPPGGDYGGPASIP